MSEKSKQPRRRSGVVERTYRVEEGLYLQAADLARSKGLTMRALIEKALRNLLAEEAADRTERTYLPEIDRVLQERHKRMEASLRSMIARSALEVLRSQYIWLNFVTEAGVSPGKVETWREQGWLYAVKEFKRQPRSEQIDDDD